MEFNLIQVIVTALLSSGFVGGMIALFTKKVASPESKNELARIGNEFAQLMLEEARSEREELRTTIKELEQLLNVKTDAVARLQRLADEKDGLIRELEERQYLIARKIQQGTMITIQDLFGAYMPKEFDNKPVPIVEAEFKDDFEGGTL